MRASQCYISQSVKDFPFKKACHLTDYVDSTKPCVFFGMYRLDDIEALKQHSGTVIIRWCGQDALDFQDWDLVKHPDIYNVSPHPNVVTLLGFYGVKCYLIPPEKLAMPATAQKLGQKIYAYCPKQAKEYHGGQMMDELSKRYDIHIADGSISQEEWYKGEADKDYEGAFIGLCLSRFAGGGATVLELGLRGVKCVTNVVNLPNAIPFKTTEDIVSAIEFERQKIGTTQRLLSKQVEDAVGWCDWLNTEWYK